MDFGDCCEAVIDSKISLISGNPIPKMRQTKFSILSTALLMVTVGQYCCTHAKKVRIGSVAFYMQKIN